MPLQKLHLNGCTFMSNQAVCSLIQMCGSSLKKFVLTGILLFISLYLLVLVTADLWDVAV